MSPVPPPNGVPDLVRRILGSCGKTLFQVSQDSTRRYGDTGYHIPHQFYSHLREPGFTPSIQQIFAFSSLTGFRVTDWLAVFGFRLDAIPTMQAILPAKRTRLLDQATHDDQQWIPWISDNPLPSALPAILPLGRLVSAAGFRRAASFLPAGRSPFLYAKVGWQDAFAYPDLVPGSIVRVDTRKKGNLSAAASDSSQTIFLVEHRKGLCFCRVHVPRSGRIVLRPTELPYPQLEWQLGREARILGTADVELRLLSGGHPPEVPRDFPSSGIPQLLPSGSVRLSLGQLLALTRARAGLSFRDASALTRRIAEEFRDKRYFCAPGALSDYETRSGPPRHLHKLLSFAILYSLGFWTLVGAAGLETEQAGQRPIPDSLLPRRNTELRTITEIPSSPSSFLRSLVDMFEEVPVFLRESLADIVSLPNLSLRDVYWMGGNQVSLHPYLKTTVMAAVNRRSKKPVALPGKPLTDQPLYLLLRRDSRYLATACHLEGDTLLARLFADGLENPQRFRNGVDAEVVGRIVALLRWVR